MADRVRSTFYAVVIDVKCFFHSLHSNRKFFFADISTKNKMAVVLFFWNGKLNSEMLKMKRCKDATAEGLFTALLAELAVKDSRNSNGWIFC